MLTNSLALLSLTLVIIFLIIRSHRGKRRLPPGPPGLPLVGNLFELLGVELRHRALKSWSQIYGPLFYLNMGGKPAIVIGNHKIAKELLEARGNIYSDRPANIVVAQIMTRGLVYAFVSPRSNSWGRMRKASHAVLNHGIAKKYHGSQNLEAVLLVKDLLQAPHFYAKHIQRATTSSLLSIFYGFPPNPNPFDPTIVAVNEVAQDIADGGAPGQYLVEYFPFLKYLPSRLLKWRRYAEGVYLKTDSFFQELYQRAEKQVEAGNVAPSVATGLAHEDLTTQEKAWLVGTLFAAGAETTAEQLLWFLLGMALYPDIQTKAQMEIDEIIGRDRLPTLNDLEKLPYIHALVRELLRWRGVAPLGVPHALSEDDYYEGYFIPKGTDCIVNVWALNHDRDVYGPDADSFRPERYLDESGQIKLVAGRETREEGTFGFGRRVCVGKHVAFNSLFVQIATILWCFTISPGTDETGKPMHLDETSMLDNGLTVQPLPTNKYNIVPRFSEVEEIVKHSLELNGFNVR